MPMRAYISTFWTPKNGARPEEYEDASCIGPGYIESGDFEGDRLSVAVADGASEAFLAGRWAADLTRRFAISPDAADLATVITDCVAGWDGLVGEYLEERRQRQKPIQWYEEPGLDQGAYAAVIGVRLVDTGPDNAREGQLDAWALGDSCLFQVRNDQLIHSFPIDDPTAFDNTPPLAHSRAIDFRLTAERIRHHAGVWRSGDELYLATDALSQWFLFSATAGGTPWTLLRDLGTDDGPGSFEDWVAQCRAAREIRNDDTTLLRIDIY
jgi:hypothetical protein